MLTPQQKREATMRARYGDNWRDVIGKKSRDTFLKRYGREKYAEQGRKGNAQIKPENRPFAKDRKLASRAAKKARQKKAPVNENS